MSPAAQMVTLAHQAPSLTGEAIAGAAGTHWAGVRVRVRVKVKVRANVMIRPRVRIRVRFRVRGRASAGDR